MPKDPVLFQGESKQAAVDQPHGYNRQEGLSKLQWNSTTTHHASGFWDSLSKIHLTRHALQEFDRRDALNPRKAVSRDGASQTSIQDIKRFPRAGGPDLSDIMGYPQPASIPKTSSHPDDLLAAGSYMASRAVVPVPPPRVVESTTATSISKRSSAYSANFMTKLGAWNVQFHRRANKPANFEELQARLKNSRASLAPSQFSEERYDSFMDAIENASDESTVMTDLLPTIQGNHFFLCTQNRPCKNWKPLIDADLVIPQPDFFDGVRQGSQYRQIREILDTLIVPSTVDSCPFLPNFFGEVKAPKGSSQIAECQACYDGAFGARAMHHLQSYGNKKTYDSNAYTFTFTYCDGIVRIYAHYMSQPDGLNTAPHYHMTRLGDWSLQRSRQDFAEGAAAFRNLRDLAHELREQFLENADRRMQGASEGRKAELFAEAVQRVQGILPDIESFEDVVLKRQSQKSQPAHQQASKSSPNEASGNESDITYHPREA